MRFSYLWTAPYTDYQQFLFNTITTMHEQHGKNFKQIAQWFNEHGYLTPRGHTFKNNHAHSIYRKKNISIRRFNREYAPVIKDVGIDITDITPNKVSSG